MKYILLLPFLFAFTIGCSVSTTHNLITNGGFDQIEKCPTGISQLKLATGWFSSGSPDLFCTCANSKSVIYPKLSFVGSLLPYSGDCYCGFIVNPQYKEYVTYALEKKIRRRKTYCISFLYSRSAFSGMKIGSLGIYLHKEMYSNAKRGQPMYNKTAKVQIADHPGIWSSASFTFVSRGGEKFITIGSFEKDLSKAEYVSSNQNKKNARIFNYGRSGYYFIED